MLAEMPRPKRLSLSSAALIDAGLPRLRATPAPAVLWLHSDSITASGLEPLANIGTLKQIRIGGSKILSAEAAEFAKAHPGIAVSY